MPATIVLGISFWVISLSGALSPGPLTALAITEGARSGRWSGAKMAVGHGLTEIVLIVGITYGLGSLLQNPWVGGFTGLVGGAFLLWMGYGLTTGAWRGQLTLASAQSAPPPAAMRLGPVAAGVLLSLANPYWALWWVTIGAGYILRVANLGLLGIGFFYLLAHWTTDVGWLSGLSWAVASGRGWLGEGVYRGILLVCGVFLVAMSLFFAYSGWQFLAPIIRLWE